MEATALVGASRPSIAGTAPVAQRQGCAQHRARDTVDGELHAVEVGRHPDRRDRQLHVDIEEGAVNEQEPVRCRGEALLEGSQRARHRAEHRAIHAAAVKALDAFRRLRRRVAVEACLAEELFHRLLNLDILSLQPLGL